MRGRLLAALLACTAVLVAGAAVAPASVAAQDSSVTAEIEYVNEQADVDQIEVSPEDGTLSFASAGTNASDAVRTWSIEGDAVGQLEDNDAYSPNLTAQYQLSDADVGSTFDVVLTVSAPDGTSATDRVTVSVVANDSDPGGDPAPSNLSAEITYLNGPSGAEQVEVTPGDGTLSFWGSASSHSFNGSELNREWSIEGDAAGSLEVHQPNDGLNVSQYTVAEADVGSTFDVVLTVSAPDGTSATDSVTVSVSENGSDPGTGPGDDPASTNVTADLQYVNEGAQTDPIEVSADAGTLSFVGLGSAEDDSSVVRTWSLEGEAAGALVQDDSYEINHTVQYEVTEADVGNTFDVVLTVTAADGSAATDSVTVSVSENGSDPGTGPGDDPASTNVTADLQWVNGEAQVDPIEVSADAGTLTFVGLGSAEDGSSVVRSWSLEGDAAGQLTDADDYELNHTIQYEVTEADAGNSFDVVLTVTAPDGSAASDSVTVSVLANETDPGTDPGNETDPGTDPGDTNVTADLQYVNGAAQANPIEVSTDVGTLTFVGIASAENGTEVVRTWSLEGDAAGQLTDGDAYEINHTVQYEVTEADAGNSFDLVFTATSPDGSTATDRVTISVSGSDSGTDPGTDPGSGISVPPGNDGGDDGDDDDDSSDDEGGTDDDDADESPGEFTLSASSSGDQVVITGENARQGDTASTDLGVAVGALQLSSFEATAGQDADSFELTLGSASGPAPMEERVVGGLMLGDSGMLSASTLEFAIDESQLSQGVASEDLVVYGKQEGTWTETDVQVGQDGAAVDLSAYDRIAILEPEGANGGAGDDSMSGFSVAVVVGLLVAIVAGGYYVRD